MIGISVNILNFNFNNNRLLSPDREVVHILLQAGASPNEETKSGLTPVQIAAKFGHSQLVEIFAKNSVNMRQVSRKLGLSALHVSAFYGEEDFTRELVTHIPAQPKSSLPMTGYALAKVLLLYSTVLHC